MSNRTAPVADEVAVYTPESPSNSSAAPATAVKSSSLT
jgi:hypothetical protein